jgi:hypothetical protein
LQKDFSLKNSTDMKDNYVGFMFGVMSALLISQIPGITIPVGIGLTILLGASLTFVYYLIDNK